MNIKKVSYEEALDIIKNWLGVVLTLTHIGNKFTYTLNLHFC